MKKLSQAILNDVTSKINHGQSSRNIAQSLGLSKSSVNNIRNSLPESTTKPKAGAPQKLNDRDKRDIVRKVILEDAEDAVAAARIANRGREKPISPETVRRVLREYNWESKSKIKKPKLLNRHKSERLKWAQKYKEWTVYDWKRIVWSDETKINRIQSDGLKWSWVRKGDTYSDRRFTPTVKFGGGNVMMWGCLTFAGVGQIAFIEGRMDAQQYIDILDRSLVPTLDACSILPGFPSRQELIFQQDNDPKHTSKKAKDWFSGHNIVPMKWPSQSPDLNPIEHCWSQLKRLLNTYPEPPKGVHELRERVRAEWRNIPVKYCQSLIESMPKRVVAVLKKKGGNTRY